MGKKQIVKDRQQLASIIAQIEGGKSQIKIGDVRQALKILKTVDLQLTKTGYKSVLVMLRKEVIREAKK
jgi:hypothetical protein